MSSYIEIGNYVFRNVNAVSIESSWKNLTQRAKIKLPNIKALLEKNIKPGDPVIIKLGYNSSLNIEYEGFVSTIAPSTPIEITCEDEMWKLKQQTVTMSWRSVTLKEVLKYLVPDATIECPDIILSPFRIDKLSKAKALEKLKDEFTLVIYFRGKNLYAGLAYQEKDLGRQKYHFQKNIAHSSLVYKGKDDVKIKVKAISIMPNNTKIDTELGDADGEQRTLHFYNLTLAELKKQAQEKINLMKYDGYRGTFTGFGVPVVKHGMVAELLDNKYPERAGSYFIDSVNTTYDSNGFRREIELGRKAGTELIL